MTISNAELFATVRRRLAEVAERPEQEITMDLTLDNLGIDSLDVLRLAAQFESELNIEIETKELLSIHTVGDIVERISAKLPT